MKRREERDQQTMSSGYKAIQWSHHKRVYDAAAASGVALCVGVFFLTGRVWWGPGNSDVQLAIRALGLTAIVMLHVVLAIGPLARLDRRWLPLLFNRRHLGVMLFFAAAAHAGLSLLFYHAGGAVNPLISMLTGGPGGGRGLAFEVYGAGALLILFLMAATSHDFWLRNLGSQWWKRLHMLVYLAYGLLVLHVVFGAMQSERSILFPLLLAAGVTGLTVLHVIAGRREAKFDKAVSDRGASGLSTSDPDAANWVDVCAVAEIPEGRGRPCPVTHQDGRIERVAVFRYLRDGQPVVSATANVCAHQGGPLGEGRVIDGCATCPWHGWQYRPHDGCAPPPFTERIRTYRVRVVGERVQVDPRPLAPGTATEPAVVSDTAAPTEVARMRSQADKLPADSEERVAPETEA